MTRSQGWGWLIVSMVALFIESGWIEWAAAQTPWEPNNTRQQAIEVTSPDNWEPRVATSLESIEGSADNDWFFMDGTSLTDKWVSVWIEPMENPGLDTIIALYAGDESIPVAENDDIRNGNPGPIRQSGVAGASFPKDEDLFVQVYPWNHEAVIQGSYRLNFLDLLAGPAFEESETEPNDTAIISTSFPINHYVNGKIGNSVDEDWFIVGKSVPRNEDLLIVIKNESSGLADFILDVYNHDGTVEYGGISCFGGVGENDYLRIPFGSHTDDFISLRVHAVSGTGNYRLFFGTGMAAVCPGPLKNTQPETIPDWSGGNVGKLLSIIQVPPGFGVISNPRIFVDVSHDYLLDLDIELEHKDTGTKVLLFNNSCTTNDNISTIFDDAAGSLPCPPVLLSAKPEQALQVFNGESAEGSWELTLSDVTPGNVGVLNQWSLLIPTPEPTFTPTPTPVPTHTPTPICSTTADLNGDGKANARDLIELLRQRQGMTPLFGNGDLDCSGQIDDIDFILFQDEWME